MASLVRKLGRSVTVIDHFISKNRSKDGMSERVSVEWSEGRDRHESRTQSRSVWALKARQPKNLPDTPVIERLLAMEAFEKDWGHLTDLPDLEAPGREDYDWTSVFDR